MNGAWKDKTKTKQKQLKKENMELTLNPIPSYASVSANQPTCHACDTP